MNFRTIFALSAVVVSSFAFGANPPGFTDDYDAALKRASAENKMIFAVFSGSDWCHWCKVLEKDYLSKREFTDAVTNDLVCLFVDNPNDKSVLSEKAKANNERLTRKYEVHGFPTLMFIDAKGSKVCDAKRRKMKPGEWGRFLVSSAKDAVRKAPLIEKHIKPFQDRMDAIGEKSQEDAAAVSAKPLKEEAKTAEFRRIFERLKKQFAELKKEVEAYKFPEELKDEKEELLEALGQFED